MKKLNKLFAITIILIMLFASISGLFTKTYAMPIDPSEAPVLYSANYNTKTQVGTAEFNTADLSAGYYELYLLTLDNLENAIGHVTISNIIYNILGIMSFGGNDSQHVTINSQQMSVRLSQELYFGQNEAPKSGTYYMAVETENGGLSNVQKITIGEQTPEETPSEPAIDIIITGVTLSQDKFFYNGKEQKPTIARVDTNAGVATADQYEVKWQSETIEPGTYTVGIIGKNGVKGSFEKKYTIEEVSLTGVKLSQYSFIYNEKTQKPTITSVTTNAGVAAADQYEVTMPSGDTREAGTYPVIITGKNGVKGSIKTTYTITSLSATIDKEMEANEVTLTKEGTKEVAKLIEDISAGKNIEGMDETLLSKVKTAMANGDSIGVKVSIDTVKESQVQEDANKIKAKVGENVKILEYQNIDVNVLINGVQAGKVTKLKNKIKLTMKKPQKDLIPVKAGFKRVFKIVKVHNGVVTTIETKENGDEVIGESDEFSTYALTYEDIEEVEQAEKAGTITTTSSNPKTGDVGIAMYIGLMIVSMLGLVATVKFNK